VIVDFHTHIFPPDIVERRDEYRGRDATFATLYGKPNARLATAEDLIESMDIAGVDVSVALGFAWRDPDICRLHSEYLLESAARFPGRIVPFPIVNPGAGVAAKLGLEQWGHLAKGIGELRPNDQGFELDSPAGDLLAEAANLGLTLLFHVSEPVGHDYAGKGGLDIGAFYRFLTRHPGTRVVGAHWAGGLPLYAVMPEVRSVFQYVYVDTSASSLLYHRSIFASVIHLIGVERILFGSDFPLLSQKKQLALLDEAGLSVQQRMLITGGNAAPLLGLHAQG
jgi:predicted TIM-barrel fold metal-dependent hydrolase